VERLLRLKLEEELSAKPFQRTCDHRGAAGTEVQDHHSLEVLGLASATTVKIAVRELRYFFGLHQGQLY
jgi:hypothetical protein